MVGTTPGRVSVRMIGAEFGEGVFEGDFKTCTTKSTFLFSWETYRLQMSIVEL